MEANCSSIAGINTLQRELALSWILEPPDTQVEEMIQR